MRISDWSSDVCSSDLHLGLGLLLRVKATDGYLGSMRTVHFAPWAFLNNCSRLLFFSNFDHSWGSYLDDFIEKAPEEIGRASCRERVCQCVSVLVVAGSLKKKSIKARVESIDVK